MEKSEKDKLPSEGQGKLALTVIESAMDVLGSSSSGNLANSSILSIAILPFSTDA